MKNKIQKLKFGLIVFAIWLFGLSFTSASTTFHLNVEKLGALSKKMLNDNMMYVHFADNWNNFWGFFYFSNGLDDLTGSYQVWTTNTSNYECSIQMKWFYYNAERWERLWPLDRWTSETWGVDSALEMSWWLYTSCAKPGYNDALKICQEEGDDQDTCVDKLRDDFKPDGFWYYWSLNHIYSWKEFHLVAGVNYTGTNQFLSIQSGSDLAPTFVRINNRYPVGFVYDYNGWVGLAWCRFDEPKNDSMKNLVEEYNNNRNRWLSNMFILTGNENDWYEIVYTWSVTWVNCSGFSATEDLVKILIEWIVWMDDSGNTKFWTLGNSNNAKMQYFGTKSVSNTELMNYAAKKAESLCRWKWGDSYNNNDKIICWSGWTINTLIETIKSNKQTLIVKKWDVTIKPFDDRDDTTNYDIYLLDGNLIINETGARNFVFNTGWFVSNANVTGFNEAVSWDADNYISWDAVVWSFIRWNFIINWYVTGMNNEKLKNKYFIYGKFTTKDTISSLERVFSWRCNNGIGSDGNYCPVFKGNPYYNAALIVIDQNYSSPLLQS